jgi:hypothetical protein
MLIDFALRKSAINDWRDVVNVSMWSERQERIGAWDVRPAERALLTNGVSLVQTKQRYWYFTD